MRRRDALRLIGGTVTASTAVSTAAATTTEETTTQDGSTAGLSWSDADTYSGGRESRGSAATLRYKTSVNDDFDGDGNEKWRHYFRIAGGGWDYVDSVIGGWNGTGNISDNRLAISSPAKVNGSTAESKWGAYPEGNDNPDYGSHVTDMFGAIVSEFIPGIGTALQVMDINQELSNTDGIDGSGGDFEYTHEYCGGWGDPCSLGRGESDTAHYLDFWVQMPDLRDPFDAEVTVVSEPHDSHSVEFDVTVDSRGGVWGASTEATDITSLSGDVETMSAETREALDVRRVPADQTPAAAETEGNVYTAQIPFTCETRTSSSAYERSR